MQNFKEILLVDPSRILEELKQHPELWDQHKYRTGNDVHGEASDILLRCNDPNASEDWFESVNYPALFLMPAAEWSMRSLAFSQRADRIGRVMITKLPPGGKILPHTDDRIIPGFCQYWDRFHICLTDNQGKAPFKCGDEEYHPKLGQVFWFDNSLEHSVENNSDTDRLTMIVDLKKLTMKKFFGAGELPNAPEIPEEAMPTKFLMDVKQSKLHPDITYQREHVADVQSELESMLHEHYKELALNQDQIPLAPNWDQYKRLEKALIYHFYTIRDQGELIGYYGCTIGNHLHYNTTAHATTDLFWIDPAYRKLGVGREFFHNIEQLLKDFSIKKVVVGTKAHKDHSRFFESLGYTLSDYQFVKML